MINRRGVEDEIVDKIQKNADENKNNISQMILQGVPLEDLVSMYLKGLSFTEIPHDYDVKYECPCTKERVSRALTLLGADDLQDMIEKKEPAEVICQMCGRKYELVTDELQVLKEELHRNSLH